MFDDLEDGPRLGLWAAALVLALALLGVVGGMVLRQWRAEHGPMVVSKAPGAAVAPSNETAARTAAAPALKP